MLISPFSVSGIDWQRQLLDVSISRKQVESSPSIDFDKPVSRQHEAAFLDYYGYPYYWGGSMMWGISASPAIATPPPDAFEAQLQEDRKRQEQADLHLRSDSQVTGYHIEAEDGMIGHVEDFLFDPQTWALRYFIVDTRNWLPGRHVLLSTEWIDKVSWDKRIVRVPLSRETIRNSPEWQEGAMLDQDEEHSLHRHYGKTLDAGLRGGQLR
ncbi:MAG: PRC-barrel domain-containing protein [Pseudomonadota bacterium]|nr:PRC-barrel domain-containing protein [Pseudomonadota bacterium]